MIIEILMSIPYKLLGFQCMCHWKDCTTAMVIVGPLLSEPKMGALQRTLTDLGLQCCHLTVSTNNKLFVDSGEEYVDMETVNKVIRALNTLDKVATDDKTIEEAIYTLLSKELNSQ